MLFRNHQTTLPMALPTQFGSTKVAANVGNIAEYFSTLRSDVIRPTATKSKHRFQSSVSELRAALAQSCGSAGADIGEFLRILDCWLDEAMAWWSEVGIVGQQLVDVSTALVGGVDKARREIAGSLNVDPSTSVAELEARARIARVAGLDVPDFNFKFLEQQLRLAAVAEKIGRQLVEQAADWRKVTREANSVSPILRDTWILVDEALQTGELNERDPGTAAFIDDLKAITNEWKFEIVNRIVDLAFASVKRARELSELNQRIIAVNFQLSALAPQILALWQSTLDSLSGLLRSLDSMSIPSDALRSIGKAGGEGIKDLIEPTAQALGGLILKIGAAALGIGLAVFAVSRLTGNGGDLRRRERRLKRVKKLEKQRK